MKCVWCETNEADGICNDGKPPYCLECQEMLMTQYGCGETAHKMLQQVLGKRRKRGRNNG